MRATVDLDTYNIEDLHDAIYTGAWFLGEIPEVRLGNSKGYHLIWRGCSEELSWWVRYLLDDPNRCKLDLKSDKRLNQVVFSKKDVYSGEGDLINEGGSIAWK